VRTGDGLVFFESTANGVICVPVEFYVNSIYWHTMKRRFHKVVVRCIYTHGRRGISLAMRRELLMYVNDFKGRPFERNPLECIRPVLGISQSEDFSSFFCSELAAGAYKRMGLLPESRSANDYLPRDFSSVYRYGRLPLPTWAQLGPEQPVTFSKRSIYSPRGLSELSLELILPPSPSLLSLEAAARQVCISYNVQGTRAKCNVSRMLRKG